MNINLLRRFSPKQRRWILAGAAAALALLAVLLLWPRGRAPEAITGENLLSDGDFEAYAQSGGGAWYTDAYVRRDGITTYDIVTEDDGEISAHIRNMAANDARFAQAVSVRPDSLYCLEGDIRASATGGLGANLSVEGPYVFSESVYDQANWTHIRLYGRTAADQDTVTVFVRLGGYSGESVGEAWFRHIRLTEVSEVPEGYWTYDWYTKSYEPPVSSDVKSAKGQEPFFHQALMILALAVYAALAWWTVRRADRKHPLETGGLCIFALFAAALAVRIVMALLIHGYDVDVNDFCIWASAVADSGMAKFYATGFCDYPPGYILLLWFVGLLGKLFDIGVTEFMIKIPPILADLLTAGVILRAMLPRRKDRDACTPYVLGVLALLLFNPLILLNGAGWGQSDSVMMFFLVLTVVFGMRRNWIFALPAYVVAVLMKPQALMFGPMGLAALFVQYREIRDDLNGHLEMLISFLAGLGTMLLAALIIVLPFSVEQGSGWLFRLYGTTMSHYDSATVNACNAYFLAGGNWAGISAEAPRLFGLLVFAVLGLPAGWLCMRSSRTAPWPLIPLITLCTAMLLALAGLVIPMTWVFWSVLLMAIVIALSLALFIQRGQLKHLPLYGGLLMTGLFALGGMMHERYLFPAVILLLWAWHIEDDDRILFCALLVTAGALLNVGCVLSRNLRIGGADGHLTYQGHSSDMAVFEYLSAILNTLAFSVTAWVGLASADADYAPLRLAVRPVQPAARPAAQPARDRVSYAETAAREELYGHAPLRRPDRKDLIIILAVTLVYAAVAFWHLGSLTSPQTGYELHAHYVPNPDYKPPEETAPAGGESPDGAVLDSEALDSSVPDSEFMNGEVPKGEVLDSEVPDDEVPDDELPDGGDPDSFDPDNWDPDTEDEAEAFAQEPYILVREAVTFDLGERRDAFRMLYMGSVHETNTAFTVETSDDGVAWTNTYDCTMDIGGLFQWNYVRTFRGGKGLDMSGRYVRLTSQDVGLTLMEVLFRTPEGEVIPVAGAVSSMGYDAGALCDEQHTLEGEPGWFNSMYFDEIYHARTAYEHLMGMYPYETTHPPLGKVMMSWCVALFGMTPFGWRFAGTLAGVLMLPGLYLTARLLFKKRRFAVLCVLMLALDTLHYTQTRLATIDSYAVLFIIWSYYFMFRWMYTDVFGSDWIKSYIPLGLSGLMMGLAVASKWTGCYAGVGLAILFFVSIARRIIAIRQARKEKDPADERVQAARNEGMKRLFLTAAGCLIFFVAVPALIYYLSYIPYFAPSGGVSLEKIVQAAQGMLSYHSAPGLGMDHPYYSPWYEWPFAVMKPMYYAADRYEPAGYASSILAFGNIGVWWVGFAAMLAVLAAFLWKQAGGMIKGYSKDAPATALSPRGQHDLRPALLVIAFAAQYLPWTLVPRGTYIYHYFPSVPFIILATGLVCEYLTDWLTDRAAARALRSGTSPESAAQRADWLCLLGVGAYLLIVAALFIAFFPYASGLMVRTGWLNAMNWFGNLYY